MSRQFLPPRPSYLSHAELDALACPLYTAPIPRTRGYHRKKHFTRVPEDAAACARLVRGAMADQLDRDFSDGMLGTVLWQGVQWLEGTHQFVHELCELARENDREGMVRLLQRFGLDVYQAIASCLFAEIFTRDPDAEGLVPDVGPRRVGLERFRAFAALIRDPSPSRLPAQRP